jgi:hypothetical protein
VDVDHLGGRAVVQPRDGALDRSARRIRDDAGSIAAEAFFK